MSEVHEFRSRADADGALRKFKAKTPTAARGGHVSESWNGAVPFWRVHVREGATSWCLRSDEVQRLAALP